MELPSTRKWTTSHRCGTCCVSMVQCIFHATSDDRTYCVVFFIAIAVVTRQCNFCGIVCGANRGFNCAFNAVLLRIVLMRSIRRWNSIISSLLCLLFVFVFELNPLTRARATCKSKSNWKISIYSWNIQHDVTHDQMRHSMLMFHVACFTRACMLLVFASSRNNAVIILLHENAWYGCKYIHTYGKVWTCGVWSVVRVERQLNIKYYNHFADGYFASFLPTPEAPVWSTISTMATSLWFVNVRMAHVCAFAYRLLIKAIFSLAFFLLFVFSQ